MGGTLIYRSKAFEAQTIPAAGVISLGSIQVTPPSTQLYYPLSVSDPCAGNTWKTSAYKASATTITSSAIYADSSIFGPGQAVHTVTYQYNTVYLWDNEDGTAPSPPSGAIYMSRTTKLLDPATNNVTRVASTQYWVPSTVLLSDGTILPITNPGYIATLFADNNGYMSDSNKHVDGGSWGNVPSKALIMLGIAGPSVTTWAIGLATSSGVKIQSILPVPPTSPATISIGGVGVFYSTAVGGSTWILSGLYTNSVTGAIAADYRVSKDDGVTWAVVPGPPYTGTVLNMSYTMILDTREQLSGYGTLPIMVLVRTSTGTSGYISHDACTSWELAWTLDAKYALLGEVVPIGKYALDRG
jgi:hypothetical protein